MSYGTGSVGLNLQFTNYVFLFDRWWNPAVEDQAINRAHRLGQKATVFVTRFIAQETIEGRIAEVLEKKRALFNDLIAQNGPPPSLGLTEDEIFGLFSTCSPTDSSGLLREKEIIWGKRKQPSGHSEGCSWKFRLAGYFASTWANCLTFSAPIWSTSFLTAPMSSRLIPPPVAWVTAAAPFAVAFFHPGFGPRLPFRLPVPFRPSCFRARDL